MEEVTDEIKFTVIQFFLDDPTSEQPKVHGKRKEKRRGTIIKEIEMTIRDLEENEIKIDLDDYKNALKFLRKMKSTDEYNIFVEELLTPYF